MARSGALAAALVLLLIGKLPSQQADQRPAMLFHDVLVCELPSNHGTKHIDSAYLQHSDSVNSQTSEQSCLRTLDRLKYYYAA